MDQQPSAPATTPAKAQPVLVLQGGGALGSYQAGAYQALCHFDFEPEWIAGISIGAINAAIIAGNEREKRIDRLKEFWNMVSSPVSWNPVTAGALRPGFPSVVIEGEHYWDGGIASNTPLDFVLGEEAKRDLLIFQVDLFSACGLLPESLLDAAEREKDIRFSSRTRMNTDKNRQIHNARMAVRDLIGKLPDYLKNDPSVELLREAS